MPLFTSLFRLGVDIDLLAVGLYIAVSHVVAKQVNDIGAFCCGDSISFLGEAQTRSKEQAACRVYKFIGIHTFYKGVLKFAIEKFECGRFPVFRFDD